MDRDLHPAGTYDGAAESGLQEELLPRGMAKPYWMEPPRPSCLAKPSLKETSPSQPGEAIPEPTQDTTAGMTRRPGQQTLDIIVVHPTQTEFTCPDCRLTYPTHHSLVRHVGVSHKRLKLSITFQCALCEYTNEKLRSTSLHFRHTHGAAIPPTAVVGSNAKEYPFCPRTFPSAHSCSTHIQGMHMAQASAQRAKEAAERDPTGCVYSPYEMDRAGNRTVQNRTCAIWTHLQCQASSGDRNSDQGPGQRVYKQVPKSQPNLGHGTLSPGRASRSTCPPRSHSFQPPLHREPRGTHTTGPQWHPKE